MKKRDKNIPSYHESFNKISTNLAKYKALSALFLDCSELGDFEKRYGKKIYMDIMKILKETINSMAGVYIRKDDIISSNYPSTEQFFIFLSYKRNDKDFLTNNLEKLVERVTDYLNEEVSKRTLKLVKDIPNFYVGHAIVIYNSSISIERLLNGLMEDAKKMAEYQKFRFFMRNKEKIQELIYKEKITTVYQPVLNITTCEVIGYEALTRGPEGTNYENPYKLFKAARDVDLVFELDRICKKRAFINASTLLKDKKIFINSLPAGLKDPEFRSSNLKNLLERSKIIPSNVVFEITEQEAISDYVKFKEVLKHYTDQGIAIAIDDTGAGYSNFETIMELKPDYIKIDISMIRGIDKNSLKQELTRALVNISRDIGSIVIAEGIETDKEYQSLKQLGVSHGQGFLFAKPAFPLPSINPKYCKKKE